MKREREGTSYLNADMTKLAMLYWEHLNWEKTDTQIAKDMGVDPARLKNYKARAEFKSAVESLASAALEGARTNARRLAEKAMRVQEKALDMALRDDDHIREGLVSAKMVQEAVMPKDLGGHKPIPQIIIQIGQIADSRQIEDKTVIDGETVEDGREED